MFTKTKFYLSHLEGRIIHLQYRLYNNLMTAKAEAEQIALEYIENADFQNV